MNTQTIYESGATSHAVNDLILFTDNTRELAELRDKIYKEFATYGITKKMQIHMFDRLYFAAEKQYIKELGKENSTHIILSTTADLNEYCTLYANDFENWKKEHQKD